eukprot:468502_1
MWQAAIILWLFVHLTKSQTDASMFGVIMSSDASTTTSDIRLLLSWNLEQWECIINETITESDEYYMCTSGDLNPNATLITNSLVSNTYEMKLELMNNSTSDLIRIHKIRVLDDDSNFYDIDTFCLPKQFHQTQARGTLLERLECCYWSQRFSYNNYAMGNRENDVLQISYAQFRSNVLNYPNQAHEGAIKPPVIKEMGITILDTSNATSASTYSLKLHWDAEEYIWNNLIPIQQNKTYTKTFSQSNNLCEFSSGFSLEMSASANDPLGIDSIIIKDETNSYYNINMFCNSDQIELWQRYNYSGENCRGQWIDHKMFYGFIYNGTGNIYFLWDETVFLNVNRNQEALVLNDDLSSEYSCNANDDSPKKVTIFKDKMNDPLSTGWKFTGSYTESLNAVNCPGGSGDKCARLAGNNPNSDMRITIDFSQYVNLILQWDVTLSTMPSGKYCRVDRAFDANGFSTASYVTSSGTSLQSFPNQTYNVPDYIDRGYTNLTIRFLNNAVYGNEYCYFDNFYMFGDYLIEFDPCDSFDSSWTIYYATVATTNCVTGTCIQLLSSSYYAIKHYNISDYNNLVLRADFKTQWQCNIYYYYGEEPDALLGNVAPPTSSPTYYTYNDVEFSVPDSDICGASVLNIKFKTISNSYSCTVDNIVLWGNRLDTVPPTASPTLLPTTNPTQPTINPSKFPTSNPTFNPSSNPTTNPSTHPSNTPTNIPTVHPTSTTTGPTNPTFTPTHPTTQPTNNPTVTPTNIPTSYPSETPTTAHPSVSPIPSYPTTIAPSTVPTSGPTTYPSKTPTTNPSLFPTRIPTSTPNVQTTGPTSGPIDTPTSGPRNTKKPNKSPITLYYGYCKPFDMNITTTFPSPNVLYKNLVLLSLITNATKYSIYQNIKNTHVYNISQHTNNLWESFAIYSLQFIDISNGVDFLMECCSIPPNITNIIISKMKADSLNEIDHYIQYLLRKNIPNAQVSIYIEDQNDQTQRK